MTQKSKSTFSANTTPIAQFLIGKPANTTLALSAETMTRFIAGLFLVPHGAQKLFGWFGGAGLEATGLFFENQLGFSEGLTIAFSVGFIEFFAGIALAVGLFTRVSALGATILLLVASTIHLDAGFFWTNGGFEYPILWAAVTTSFILRGGNDQSIDTLLRRKFT
ncbi:DoxX family protein [Temperatibacter marinus]|uniref:DoxX family protein n=1 Tax=Temperatibacter marinus TaxID=1456591 RepID=A0AA52H7T6_9PROT|nr:DoxX family protein [Temperatibacter marinus]WND01416.1 DoxX family protein [Temperatibacter marinus]